MTEHLFPQFGVALSDSKHYPDMHDVWTYQDLPEYSSPSTSAAPVQELASRVPFTSHSNVLSSQDIVSDPAGSQISSSTQTPGKATTGKKVKSQIKSNKWFVCDITPTCRLGFSRAEHLSRHERSHTKEKPFQCHCKKSFSRLDNWRQHTVVAHKENVEANAATELKLVQIHKKLQRENNIRKAAAMAAQLHKLHVESPVPAPQADPSLHAIHSSSELANVEKTPSALGPGLIESQRSFCGSAYAMPQSLSAYSQPSPYRLASATSSYVHHNPSFSCAPHVLLTPVQTGFYSGTGFQFPSTSDVPYNLSEDSAVAPSPSYTAYPLTPSFSLAGAQAYTSTLDMSRTLSYGTLGRSVSVPSKTPEVGKNSYSHMLLEPFRSPNPYPEAAFQPLQPSRSANIPYPHSIPTFPEIESSVTSGFGDVSGVYPSTLPALHPTMCLSSTPASASTSPYPSPPAIPSHGDSQSPETTRMVNPEPLKSLQPARPTLEQLLSRGYSQHSLTFGPSESTLTPHLLSAENSASPGVTRRVESIPIDTHKA
ncbi:hypothetical protein CROQUDRAFT_673774 [Cronartium quercuum f. sp. fusiforme G11]|uniref:C2H2-type domain-containing protein n=1 Tax=Cronartium quercuum f. sp. fusiforme G11 TaxID=708437 RepID=A0A9P6ND76_9BASI|nr:hypothetical protein CROQUDRAFT_673774 [Cronartium quercuum f. sp. fusiforme G11]